MKEQKKRRSTERTTEAQFKQIKMLQAAGIKDCEIMELMGVGQTRLSCAKKFDTWEEYRDGRKEVYSSYRKEQTDQKQTEKESQTQEPDRDQYRWVQELGLLRRQNELLQEQNKHLELISNKLAYIVEQLS